MTENEGKGREWDYRVERMRVVVISVDPVASPGTIK